MQTFQLPYGRGAVELATPDDCCTTLVEIRAGESACGFSPEAALDAPLGAPRLSQVARAGQRVAIVTSDITRPCPTPLLLQAVLPELARAGVAEPDVTLIFGLGTHRPHSDAEREQLAGGAFYNRLRCIDSDPCDCAPVGTTARGTPVEIFRPVVEADLRVCLSVVEVHYFAGYSGGAKAILPGVASRRTIAANHRLMMEPGAWGGHLEGNPVRADIEQGVALLGPTYNLNVVVDPARRLVAAFAGDLTASHRAACAVVDARCKFEIDEPLDIAVVSAGGFPRDINLYQAHKALENAACAVRPGGTIILAAECPDGIGNVTMADWFARAASPRQLLDWIGQDFVLGGHKAAAIARLRQHFQLYLVSALDDARAKQCLFQPFPSVQAALDHARARLDQRARLGIIPHGDSVVPGSRMAP